MSIHLRSFHISRVPDHTARLVFWLSYLLILTLVGVVLTRCAHAQVIVSMDLMSSKGTAPQVGRGLSAYVWNIHVAPVGPTPIPFTLIRMNFPEVRLYSKEQQADILKYRIDSSPAKRLLKWTGYLTAAGGLAVQVENTLHKSPSQLGTAITVGGLAMPIVTALASSSIPAYSIPDPCPDIIQIPIGGSLECTALANFSKAAGTTPSLPPRRINPILTDPLSVFTPLIQQLERKP